MTGADRVTVNPADDQPIDAKLGNKKPKDLLDANVAIAWTGTNGKVTGTIKNVTWTEFSGTPSEQSGHYFPFKLDDKYKGKKITVVATKTSAAKDTSWVVRLDELMKTTKKITVKDGDDVICTFDFTGATMG